MVQATFIILLIKKYRIVQFPFHNMNH